MKIIHWLKARANQRVPQSERERQTSADEVKDDCLNDGDKAYMQNVWKAFTTLVQKRVDIHVLKALTMNEKCIPPMNTC